MREFKRDTNEIKINQYCHTVKNIDKKVHPDRKLAVAIHENICKINTNNNTRLYVGVSHLCCVFCSLFLDTHMMDFRGRSGQMEKWVLPDSVKEIESPSEIIQLNEIFFKKYNDLILTHKKSISEATQDQPFDFTYTSEKTGDKCQRASGFISDDISKYINYYMDLTGFWETNINQLSDRITIIELLKKLEEKIEQCLKN